MTCRRSPLAPTTPEQEDGGGNHSTARATPRHHLLGAYKSPRFKYGDRVLCEVRGEVVVVGLSDAPIPWPLGRPGHFRESLVVYKGLARAVRRESASAICERWGVTAQTVSRWRKELGVGPMTQGTSRLKSQALRESEALAEAVARGRPAADEAERRRKISAAMKGKPRPDDVVEAMREARLGSEASAETRRKMSEAKKGKTRLAWADWELALLGQFTDGEVARRTGKTHHMVRLTRHRLGRPPADRRK